MKPGMLHGDLIPQIGAGAQIGGVGKHPHGLRWGEIAELRRSDIGPECKTVTVSRAVNHRSGTCTIDTTNSGKARTVVIPPHIRADVKAHLDTITSDLLFIPVRGGCHLDNKTFADSYLKPALKSIGRESATHHDLRHFAGTMTARVGGSVSETIARLGIQPRERH
jgi:integrase